MAKIAVKGELMLDENKDGKLSETDIKKDLEILEAKIGVWLHLTIRSGRNPWSIFYYEFKVNVHITFCS